MSFLRARQRAITALFPHPGNRTHLISNRATQGIKSVSAVTTGSVMTIKFTGNVSTKLGNTDGFAVTVNAVGGTVTDVQQPGATDELVVTFTPVGLSTQDVIVTYTPPGLVKELLSLVPLALFTETATVP